MPEKVNVSLEDLERAKRSHLRELRLIERMTDAQFIAFRRNFSIALADPQITRARAIALLKDMIATNLTLQEKRRTSEGEG
jgi:hypothetical protein